MPNAIGQMAKESMLKEIKFKIPRIQNRLQETKIAEII